jgi:anti-sigma factor RsiW
VRELLGRWYDGELDELTTHRVAAHVETCPVCCAEIESWQKIDRLLDCRLAENDTGMVEAVLSQIDAEGRSGGSIWWLRIAAAGLLAATLGGLGGWMTASDRDQSTPEDEPVSLTLLDQTFAPERQSRLDELAIELGAGSQGRL